MSENEIIFTKPYSGETEIKYVQEAIYTGKLSGDGEFTKKCRDWLENYFLGSTCLLTPSGTAALELAALLLEISPGDEIILPSYTFSSTANAFALFGARLVFVDIDPSTMNLSVDCVARAISKNTKAIVVVHYAGYPCEMDKLLEIANAQDIFIIEDAAQGFQSNYSNQRVGSIGHLGVLSFHATKNITSGGEGGLLIINDEQFIDRAEILREKGTNRRQFMNGSVDKYTWCDIGSSYLPSDLQAAFLYAQLERSEWILRERMRVWRDYDESIRSSSLRARIGLVEYDKTHSHNAHMYFIKTASKAERSNVISFLRTRLIQTAFHYIPLHLTPIGQKVGSFSGTDNFTTIESEKLLRLPLHCGLTKSDTDRVLSALAEYYNC